MKFKKFIFYSLKFNCLFYVLIICFMKITIRDVPFENRLNSMHYGGHRQALIAFRHKLHQKESLTEYDLKAVHDFLVYVSRLEIPLSSIYGNLGFCYYYMNQFDRAIEMYKRAIDIDFYQYRYWFDKGIIYFRMGWFEEAILSLKTSLELIPGAAAFQAKRAMRFPHSDLSFRVFESIPKTVSKAEQDFFIAHFLILESIINAQRIYQEPEEPLLQARYKLQQKIPIAYMRKLRIIGFKEEGNIFGDSDFVPLLSFDSDFILQEIALFALLKYAEFNAVK